MNSRCGAQVRTWRRVPSRYLKLQPLCCGRIIYLDKEAILWYIYPCLPHSHGGERAAKRRARVRLLRRATKSSLAEWAKVDLHTGPFPPLGNVEVLQTSASHEPFLVESTRHRFSDLGAIQFGGATGADRKS